MTTTPTCAQALADTEAVEKTLNEILRGASKVDPATFLAVLQAQTGVTAAIQALMRGARAERERAERKAAGLNCKP